MNIPELYQLFLQYPSPETDTRKIKPGDIFFALKGPNYNGNLFAEQALEKGAAFCICDEFSESKDARIIYTENVLDTLQSLAKHHRLQFDNLPGGKQVPFIAITGSNGKTTTKELVHQVLSSHYKCYTTKGNLNNHIGIPLTLLSVKNDADIAIIEMGANHLHEIEGYCKYTLPTHGLITNCGKAHLEGFGSEEGVRKGKGELYDYLAKTGGTVFINADYAYLKEMSKEIIHSVSYGTSNASFTGISKNEGNFLKVMVTGGVTFSSVQTQLAGDYNLPNVLAAISIGKVFGVPDDKIKMALEGYVPANSRSQIVRKGSNTVLLDAYNANPDSMKAAIENFAAMPGKKKVVILGGMMELGNESEAEHAKITQLLQQYKWHGVVLAGNDYKSIPEGYIHFGAAAEVAAWFREQDFEDSTILLKGSRSMMMEKVIE